MVIISKYGVFSDAIPLYVDSTHHLDLKVTYLYTYKSVVKLVIVTAK